MTTLVKIIITAICGLALVSCGFDVNFGQINGSGNVITEEFELTGDFTGVDAGNGWDVELVRGNAPSVVIEADENLVEIAEIEIKGDVLKVQADKNIGRATSKKVTVTYSNDLTYVEASSGADLSVRETLKGEKLKLEVSSGGSLTADAVVRNIETEASSGGTMSVSGSTENLNAQVSSGGVIKAKDLKAKYASADASSGGAADIYVTDELRAQASSGGDVDYWGDPSKVDAPKKSYSGGSVRKKG